MLNYKYKCLDCNEFSDGELKLVPIRVEDRYNIMKWRNQQMYHLRQSYPLTKSDQDLYFENVVLKLFNQEFPNQLLFSLLENNICIGYGGLVHINWKDKNAEISFIMETTIEKNRFQELWLSFLSMVEKLAFNSLSLHKIYTYAFDLRQHLYGVLQQAQYIEEARLKEHSIIHGEAFDVLIHSKINLKFSLQKATENDLDITFKWVSDKKIREYSFNKTLISFQDHKRWFFDKVNDPNCYYFIFQRGAVKIGSIRIDYNPDNHFGLISYLICTKSQGNGYGKLMLLLLEKFVKSQFENLQLKGLVMKSNIASIRIFDKLGYELISKQNDIFTFSKIIDK